MNARHDVVIVGGGIAGLATHLLCGRLGMDSVLLEAQHDHSIERGDVLHSRACELLEALGVDLSTTQPLNRFALFRENRLVREIGLHARSVRYPELCRLVRDTCDTAGNGAAIHMGTRIANVTRVADGYRVRTTGEEQFSGAFLVLATGSGQSLVSAVATPIEAKKYERFYSTIVQAADGSDPKVLGVPVEGLAWYNLAKSGPSIGVSLPRHQIRLGRTETDTDGTAALRLLEDELGGVSPLERHTYLMQSGIRLSRSFDRGLLIGDAAAVFHPLGGQGISEALRAVDRLRRVLPTLSRRDSRVQATTYTLTCAPALYRNKLNQTLGGLISDHYRAVATVAEPIFGHAPTSVLAALGGIIGVRFLSREPLR